VLRSDWLTQGPTVPAFEEALARRVRAREAVACTNGTAALHLAMLALGLGPDDAVITTPITFLADANCARLVGAEVLFADIDPTTALIDPDSVARLLEADRDHDIKAIIPVHFAGQPADLITLTGLARKHGAYLVDDACHAIGATYSAGSDTWPVGGGPHADMTVFSFHPVKHVAMGEGGAVTTDNARLAERLRLYRNHGMQKEKFVQPEMGLDRDGSANPWYYEMQELGLNYRVTEMQAALGVSQLGRLDHSLARRNEIAETYRRVLADRFDNRAVTTLENRSGTTNAYHLMVTLIDFASFDTTRADVMNRLRTDGIGTQVHYIPIHLQPYYRRVGGTGPGLCPNAEAYYDRALSLPMFPDLTVNDVEHIVERLAAALGGNK